MSLRSVNLNLLPVLRSLLREGTVSRAAAAVGLSQPATSAALARLRDVLADPLLIQVGREMRLTPRAQELIPQVEQLCATLEALFTSEVFDPRRAEQLFIIAAPDYLVFLLGRALLSVLRERAPHVSVRFVDVPFGTVENLATGELDAAICADAEIWPELHRAHGFDDSMVAVVAPRHPLLSLKRPLTSEDILEHRQLAFAPGLGRKRATEMSDANGFPRRVPNTLLATGQFMVLPFLAASSDYVARVPRSLAERAIEILPLTIVELPESGTQFDTCIFWGPLQERNVAQRWFRGVLLECLIELTGRNQRRWRNEELPIKRRSKL